MPFGALFDSMIVPTTTGKLGASGSTVVNFPGVDSDKYTVAPSAGEPSIPVPEVFKPLTIPAVVMCCDS